MFRWLDICVLIIYLVVVVGWGCLFARRTSTAERFMSAGRALPGWVVGLSIFGSYVSSISFLANPGKAYADNWNAWIFGCSLPIAAFVATVWFVPFFRRSGTVSAYQHLEQRFGAWARTYCVICYQLTQLSRLGIILYLLALAFQPLIHLDVTTIIIISGIVVTIYPFFGGSEGVIWTGAIQSLVLVAGVVICLATAIVKVPGGLHEIAQVAGEADKLSLGEWSSSLTTPTVLVVLIYGLFINLQNFGIDQSYVQRYITARSDRAAATSVWMGAITYIPLSAALFFLGTSLFAFYQIHPERLLPGMKADAALPHFIGHELAPGMMGLVLAAICSAAMDSNLNCCATLYLCDIHKRYVRPQAGDAESLWVLRIVTVVMGALSTIFGLAMIRVETALDAWWKLAGIFSGGMLGLFLLGLLSRRANNRAAFLSTVLGVITILWMTFSPHAEQLPQAARSPFHDNLTIVFGTSVIVIVGLLLPFFGRFWRQDSSTDTLHASAKSVEPTVQPEIA